MSETTDKKQKGGRFRKGESGNPRGRPRGAKHKTTLLLESLIDDEGETIIKKLIALAKKGNLLAIKLVVERLLPAKKDRAVSVALPSIKDAAGLPRLTSAILAAVSEGELTTTEAAALSALVMNHVKTLETAELSARIDRLEERKWV